MDTVTGISGFRGACHFPNRLKGIDLMYRFILMPELGMDEGDGKRAWRRVWYSVVLTSVEFFLAIVALISGLPVLLDPITLSLVPGSIAALLPVWMVDLWGLQLALGGASTIFGITKGDFRIEQIGVMLLFSGAFVYAIALGTLLPGSFVAFVTYLLFILAMAARYWVLGRLIKLTGRLKKRQLESLPNKLREE